MSDTIFCPDDFVFGLDIGTRNVVGTVGYMKNGRFQAAAIVSKEHETRAMLDGQIHDIGKVGDTIRTIKYELESMTGKKLKEVCIAAAGRVLRTVMVHEDVEFEGEVRVNAENIYSLELISVEKAHKELKVKDEKYKFYCVGYTPVRYYLNDYAINNLEGHKAERIGIDLLATFLPEEVVDGLYAAVDYAGLTVANLTLEPIAAMNVAIPEQYRLLNIALVDVGAGTSDICLTKDGSIVAYGMIPSAGDELTEIIAKEYLVDFASAEKIKLAAGKKKTITYKDIMGISHKLAPTDVQKLIDEQLTRLADDVADKICELNGDKAVSAVFVVGGGGKFPGFTDKIADRLQIARERVAVRGEEVLTSIDFVTTEVKKDALLVTPIGICINYYNQKNNFIFATVNGERVKLYDNNHLSIVDAVMQSGMPNESIFPKRGNELVFNVNGRSRIVRGSTGEAAVILLNGRESSMNTRIAHNDQIEIRESTVGESGHITVGELDEFKSTVNFIVNDKLIVCPKFAYVDNELKGPDYSINQGDNVVMENYYTVKQLFDFMDIATDDKKIMVNNEPAADDTIVYENFNVKYTEPGDEQYLPDPEDIDNSLKASQDKAELPGENHTSGGTTREKLQETGEAAFDEPETIVVTVNDSSVEMTGKSGYTFVDIFDFYPFDLKTAGGTELVTRVNGEKAAFNAPLAAGDKIELYWR